MKEQKKQLPPPDAPSREREVREVRHTISAEETFTLAKDVFDLRCLIKSIYANRAQIARRLNIVSLGFSLVYTLFYVGVMLYISLVNRLTLGWEIAVYVLAGAYALIIACIVVFVAVTRKSESTKTVKCNNKILKIFRFAARITSLVMSIVALCVSALQAENPLNLALNVCIIVFSVLSIIVTAIPLIFGGLGGMARWLISPTKRKLPFSDVVLEWYNLVTENSMAYASTQRVEKKLAGDIGRCIDGYIIPALGKKSVGAIGTNQIFSVIERAPAEDRAVTEGVLKNVFAYAVECNYVQTDPCRDLQLEGSIEVVQKPKKEPLRVRIGKKIGKSLVKNFLGEKEDE